VDPDSAESSHQDLAASRPRNGRGNSSWRDRLIGMFKSPKKPPATLAPEEEHRYRSAACPIEEALIGRLSDLTDRVREAAIEQAWSVDWTELADHRRKLAESRAAHHDWLTLRELGELIAMLGQAARYFRKSSGAANVL